jgi:hypothetical protein
MGANCHHRPGGFDIFDWMVISEDDLRDAVRRIARELPLDHVKPAIWRYLRDIKILKADSLKLTAKGKRAYNKMVVGEEVPAFTYGGDD